MSSYICIFYMGGSQPLCISTWVAASRLASLHGWQPAALHFYMGGSQPPCISTWVAVGRLAAVSRIAFLHEWQSTALLSYMSGSRPLYISIWATSAVIHFHRNSAYCLHFHILWTQTYITRRRKTSISGQQAKLTKLSLRCAENQRGSGG
jgi:hypothetical protein